MHALSTVSSLGMSAGCVPGSASGLGLRVWIRILRTPCRSAETFATTRTHSGQVPAASEGSDGVPRRKTDRAAAHVLMTSPARVYHVHAELSALRAFG